MEELDKGGGPPSASYTLLKNVGLPVIATFAMYLAYKRFIQVPSPLKVPALERNHLFKSNKLKTYLSIYRIASDSTKYSRWKKELLSV